VLDGFIFSVFTRAPSVTPKKIGTPRGSPLTSLPVTGTRTRFKKMPEECVKTVEKTPDGGRLHDRSAPVGKFKIRCCVNYTTEMRQLKLQHHPHLPPLNPPSSSDRARDDEVSSSALDCNRSHDGDGDG
jgi:hypothetical protein